MQHPPGACLPLAGGAPFVVFGLLDDDPPPAGLPPRAGSFADQAGRPRQRLDNQWFDLHPLRTVEQRVGR